ncbi:MAG TPA: helix-turn-helix domain-containing protein [Rudaea sp.]|nr:helix-turn-helix domain-containing protein [Rudaea sp.]
MSNAFERIKTGLAQAVTHAKGKPIKARVHVPEAIDVKSIRAKVGMSQLEFAASFGISVGTLRHWERGDRQPQGPARVLLQVVSKQPKAVLSALQP